MNRVRAYREKSNMSLTELSNNVEISERHLRFIESGNRTPSLNIAKRIADCLSSTIDDIFFGDDVTCKKE